MRAREGKEFGLRSDEKGDGQEASHAGPKDGVLGELLAQWTRWQQWW